MKNFKLLVILLSIISCAREPYSPFNYFDQKEPGALPEIFAPGIISLKGRFELGLTISPNGKSLAFGVADETNAEENCIYLLNFSDGRWGVPDRKAIPGNINTFFPMFSADGNELFFAKSKGNSQTDIWVAKYSNNKIIRPQPLDSIFTSDAREAGHGKSIKGSIYFTSNRDDERACCGDVFLSEMDSKGNYSTAEKVNELNTNADEESLFLSPNEDFIIIQAWKNEFQSKHDLFLSYRNKHGIWSIPERLDTTINRKEIEQRPFVSPDNKYLFFSRTTISQENKQDTYESDIYWVSTKSIFKPYAYNVPLKIEVAYNKPFKIQLPKDLFKDVDNMDLLYKMTLEGSSELPDWISLDNKTLILTGKWKDQKPHTISIYATDEYRNESVIKIPIVIR